jgi:hypothetical protein
MRNDPIVIKMVRDARTTGLIRVVNPSVRRPILDIADFCAAVEGIPEADPAPGIYNLTSFNSTVGCIARGVAERMGAEIIETEGPRGYDFSISSSKFTQTYGMALPGTLDGIVDSLIFAATAESEVGKWYA